MRDVVFLVADSTMQQTLEGFFRRDGFHQSLGCGPIGIDPRANRDVFVAAGQNDPGLYSRADELLRPHCTTHRRAVVMLDADWDGSPGGPAIDRHVSALVASVWEPDEVAVIVLEPEIEAWFWQPDNLHVKAAMNYSGDRPYREVLARAQLWPEGVAKPPRPKEALEYMRKVHRADLSPAVLRRAAQHASVRRCQDRAFGRLRDTLCRWFPGEGR